MQPLQKRHALANCEVCPLFDPKNAFVPTKFAEGESKLVVVGEAPGFHEAAKGEPFLGPSGQLLDQVLRHHGYSRKEVTYTNVCLCRPEGNATPPKAAINACRGRLLHEIGVAGSKDVLALGGTAAAVVVNDSRTITALRVGPAKDPIKQLRDAGVERVVPSWHPAYCLRTSDAFPSLVSDIAKLKDEKRDAWNPPRWKYFDDPILARSAIQAIRQRFTRVVVDIEVGIEKDISFGHPNEYDLLCVGLAYEKGSAVVIGSGALADPDVLNDLRSLLQNVQIIAHNGKFDLAGLYPILGQLELWFDTMLASYALDERPGNHGLKVLAVEKLGAPQYDLEIKQYVPKGGNYANIPRELLYKYNAYDVACTWDLYELFVPALEREDVRRVHDFLVRASNQLMFLELNGITIDKDYQRELRGIFAKRISDLENELNDIVGEVVYVEEDKGVVDPFDSHQALANLEDMKQLFPNGINPRSPKQIKGYFESQRIRVDSTNEDTIKRLLERIDSQSSVGRFCTTLLLHRRQQKLYSTYVDGIRKRLYKGRVFTTYLLHGTTCVAGSTYVWTQQGLATAERLWKEQRVDVFPDPAVKFFRSAEPKPTLTVTTNGNFSLTCTHNHKFLTPLGWKKAGELAIGDKVKVWTGSGAFGISTFGVELAQLTGIFVAEGFWNINTAAGRYEVNISTQKEPAAAFVRKYGWQDDSNRFGTMILRGKEVIQYWKEIFPACHGAYNKFVPDWIMHGSRKEILAFLRGWALDATMGVYAQGQYNPRGKKIIHWSTSSERLANEAAQLILMLGYNCKVQVIPKKRGTSKHHTSSTEDIPYDYKVQVQGEQAVELVKEFGGPIWDKHVKRLDGSEWYTPFPRQKSRDEYRVVTAVVEGEEQFVYDFTVPDRQAYVANGFYVHNSGRLASRNPNCQNIARDKDIRRQFSVSKPDNVLIQCDYKNAELRVIATLAQDKYLQEILSDTEHDFFNTLSDQLYGKGNWRKEVERIRTKAFVYGIGYGREPYSIGLEYGMSPREATAQYNAFMDLIPATAAWQRKTRERVLAGEDLVTPFGRRRRFWLITQQNKKDVLNEALSFLPQSTSSDICLSALITLRPMLRGLAFIRLTIHDAIVAESHRDKADEVSRIMGEVMEAKGRDFTDYVPFPTDATIGSNWGQL